MYSPVHFDKHFHVNSADTIAKTFKRKPNIDAASYIA